MRCPRCAAEIHDANADSCPACKAALSPQTSSAELGPTESRRDRSGPSDGHIRSGTIIADRYYIVRHLRSGGMGTVYQADDLVLRVPVALKFLSPGHAGDQHRVELLLNEVRLAREITHPNVCRLFDVGEISGHYFLSMEYVEGEDLASLLRRIGRLPKDKAFTIGLEICNGLEAAHARGILHRDLKPANLMIDANGHAKIMDFGLAILSQSSEGQTLIAGTPEYMAPEQRQGHASVQTDIYAVGLVLHQLFTGRRVPADLLGSEDSAEGASVSTEVTNDLDPTVERLIRHCLERDPGLRPSSIGAVAAVLVRLGKPPWRPSEGLGIPHRPHWVLKRKLGSGGFGETWLACHTKTRVQRVFKFCHDASKLKALQREITLFRFMRETLGGRDDIAALLDWQLDEPPFFIESDFSAAGNLLEWMHTEGGVAAVPLDQRIGVVGKMAVALAAAHSVGVLHKDVKPANVLVRRHSDGSLSVRLCDFGIGMLTERERLQAAGVTAAGFTESDSGSSSSDAGTRLYMAPEVTEGKPATTSADVYALGVMLYQMVVGDLTKAFAPRWDRDVPDELLREDIWAAVEGAPERRISAAQLAERLQSLTERRAARTFERELQARKHRSDDAARRRSNWATAVLGALLLLGLGLGLAFKRAESSARTALVDQTLRSNEAMVQLAAAAVGDKLTAAIARVEEEANNSQLRDLLARTLAGSGDRARFREDLQRHLETVLVKAKPQEFNSWVIADASATILARAPYDPVVIDRNYKYREWFNGHAELTPDTQTEAVPRSATGFSLAYTSTANGAPLLIGLATPVLSTEYTSGHGRTVLGVLNAGIFLDTFNAWLSIAESDPQAGGCPDRFVLLLHRGQLIRHPCASLGASSLPVAKFTSQPNVSKLLNASGRRSASFHDPMRDLGAAAGPALAVARSLESLPDWTLILQQDVEAALRPMTALDDDFHRPAQLALALGCGALVLLVALLWRGGQWRGRDRAAG